MKRLLCLLVVFACVMAYARADVGKRWITFDTLAAQKYVLISDGWHFREADEPSMALPSYDDSQWPIVNSMLRLDQKPSQRPKFNSVGWFRFHFVTDSSIVNKPLAIILDHFGASQVFLDGHLIKSFGKISDKAHSEYYSPLEPFTLAVGSVGEHVIAVRYAYYDAQQNYRRLNRKMAGFDIAIGLADNVITAHTAGVVWLNSSLCFLFGLFLALGLAHLFLYLYYRADRSNLYFSFFCFSISAFFFWAWLTGVANNASTALSGAFAGGISASLICMSLSGFINNLFSTTQRRFHYVAAACILGPVALYLHIFWGYLFYMGIIAFVMLEALVLTAKAMYRRQKGARIIGAGILAFSLFVLYAVLHLLIFDRMPFDSAGAGQVFGNALELTALLSIPVSMSLYLAWNFAHVNKELKANLAQVKSLSQKTIEQEQERTRMMENRKAELEKEVEVRTAEIVRQNQALAQEKMKSDSLLLNILPAEVAEELKEKGHSEAKLFQNVSIMFADFVHFTTIAERMSPQRLVDELHVCFKAFDEILSKYGVEKIKTIGDAYLAVSGLPVPDEAHAVKLVEAGLEILRFMEGRKKQLGEATFDVRIGIHSGSVVAGIVGIKKFAYDIWGDAVNTAARMEQTSEPGKINISQATCDLVKTEFLCTHRGMIPAKNKGELAMYFVEGRL